MNVILIETPKNLETFDAIYKFELSIGMELVHVQNIDDNFYKEFGKSLIEIMKLELKNFEEQKPKKEE